MTSDRHDRSQAKERAKERSHKNKEQKCVVLSSHNIPVLWSQGQMGGKTIVPAYLCLSNTHSRP